MEARSLGDVGGTPGGLGHFLIGFVMACLGGYFLANQVSVVGSYWSFYGANTFGMTLVPMLIGVGILFWNGRNPRPTGGCGRFSLEKKKTKDTPNSPVSNAKPS